MKNSKNRRILSLVVIFCICITVFLEFVDKKIMIKIFNSLITYFFDILVDLKTLSQLIS